MWAHYVYMHRKASDGEPFYVGKGKLRRSMLSYERAHEHVSRNPIWRRIEKKHGLAVEIIAHCISDNEAQRLERQLIAEIGRRDIGTGPLVNLTDGGDGHAGIIASAELRAVRSKHASGKRSDAWIKSIRLARKNGGNGGVVKHGDKLPSGWRRSLARSKTGERNPYFGKPTAVSKRVVNTLTGAQYDSIARAAAAEGLNASVLYQYLDGTRKNTTALAKL
jgi:hypothetical protein